MEFLQLMQTIINSFGAVVVVPFIIFFIALAMKVPPKKAFQSALLAGVSLEGINLLITSYTSIIAPLVSSMSEAMEGITGQSLQVFDVGWQAASLIAYSTTSGMIYLALGIVLQIVFFQLRITNVFQPSDLWNNFGYPLWGSIVALVTNNMLLGIGVMVLLNLYSLLWADIMAKRWSTYYHYPSCMIPTLAHLEPGLYAIALDPLWNLLHLNKVHWSPEAIQKKIGFLGDPMTIGLFLGLFIGIFGKIGAPEGENLTSIAGWGEVAVCGIATAAVMVVFPKITGFFAQAFGPITDAARESMKKGTSGRQWYIAINDAVGYGETATLTTGLLMMPIIIVIAFFLPGNTVLPVVDLVAIPYAMECIIAVHNGNVAKSIPTAIVFSILGLLACSYFAPYVTEAAREAGFDFPEGVALITSLGCYSCPIPAIITYAFITENPFFIGLTVVVYLVAHLFWRKKHDAIDVYLERMAAKNEDTQPVADIATETAA